MQRLEVSGAARLIYKSLGVKGLIGLTQWRAYVGTEGDGGIAPACSHLS